MSDDEIEHWVFIRRINTMMLDAHDRGDYRTRDKALGWLETLTLQHMRMMDRAESVINKSH